MTRQPRPDELPQEATSVGEHIENSLRVARELLSMDIAWIAEFRDGKKVFRAVDGDADSFGFAEGDSMPLDCSYCQRVVDGVLPSVVPDSASEPEVCDLDVTASARIGSYVGVPIELVDGTVYGTICVARHRPSRDLGDRDADFLRTIARRVAAELEDMRIAGADATGQGLNAGR